MTITTIGWVPWIIGLIGWREWRRATHQRVGSIALWNLAVLSLVAFTCIMLPYR
jgi:hypothetical protein